MNETPSAHPERRRRVCTDADIAAIVDGVVTGLAQWLAQRDQERIDKFYQRIGKALVRRAIWIVGFLVSVAGAWLHGSGKITFTLFGG